jgi:hypothetical protein
MMDTATLKQRLADWTDWDGAEYELAVCLGLMTSDTPFSTRAKHVFWSNNPVGNTLRAIIDHLVEIQALEMNDDEQYRWNSTFKGSWED